jgi:hypothetical protein
MSNTIYCQTQQKKDEEEYLFLADMFCRQHKILCKQASLPAHHLSYLKIRKKFDGWFTLFNATFNNISVISWQSVLLIEETVCF